MRFRGFLFRNTMPTDVIVCTDKTPCYLCCRRHRTPNPGQPNAEHALLLSNNVFAYRNSYIREYVTLTCWGVISSPPQQTANVPSLSAHLSLRSLWRRSANSYAAEHMFRYVPLSVSSIIKANSLHVYRSMVSEVMRILRSVNVVKHYDYTRSIEESVCKQ